MGHFEHNEFTAKVRAAGKNYLSVLLGSDGMGYFYQVTMERNDDEVYMSIFDMKNNCYLDEDTIPLDSGSIR